MKFLATISLVGMMITVGLTIYDCLHEKILFKGDNTSSCAKANKEIEIQNQVTL